MVEVTHKVPGDEDSIRYSPQMTPLPRDLQNLKVSHTVLLTIFRNRIIYSESTITLTYILYCLWGN
jgi:hypothetical protein